MADLELGTGEPKSEGRYHSAVITFRPDNFLTVGLMFVVVYLAAALLAQGAMRFGLISGATKKSATGAMPAPGTVAAA